MTADTGEEEDPQCAGAAGLDRAAASSVQSEESDDLTDRTAPGKTPRDERMTLYLHTLIVLACAPHEHLPSWATA